MGESVDLSKFGEFGDHVKKVDKDVMNLYTGIREENAYREADLGSGFYDFSTGEFDTIAFDRTTMINALLGNGVKGHKRLEQSQKEVLDINLGEDKDQYVLEDMDLFRYHFSPEKMFNGLVTADQEGLVDIYYSEDTRPKAHDVIRSEAENPEYQDLVEDEDFEYRMMKRARSMVNGLEHHGKPLAVDRSKDYSEAFVDTVDAVSSNVAIATHSKYVKKEAENRDIVANVPEYLLTRQSVEHFLD